MALREWAYARSYESSSQRTEHLPDWLHRYNWHRLHSSLGYLPPVSRLKSLNNLVGIHSEYNTRRPHSVLGYKPPASRISGYNLLQLNN